MTEELYVLLLSATPGPPQCLAAGMNDYLAKPFLEGQLLAILHEWLPAPACLSDQVPSPLYQLTQLRKIANQDESFVAYMLNTFLTSSEITLTTLRTGLEQDDMVALKEAAHEIRPSVAHLNILPLLPLLRQLENWQDVFNRPALETLIENIERLLKQVLAQISQDLEEGKL